MKIINFVNIKDKIEDISTDKIYKQFKYLDPYEIKGLLSDVIVVDSDHILGSMYMYVQYRKNK